MAKKKAPAAEKENAERWLLTYADLITLLLVLFIVLYSMSQVSKAKFEGLSESLAIVFGNIGRSGVLDGGRTVTPGPNVYKAHRAMQNTEERVKRLIASMGLQGKISAVREERGLVISIKDSVLFLSGSAGVEETAKGVLRGVGAILSVLPNSVRVEGHTDNDHIHTERFYSNWELSTSRATNVLQYLILHCGFSPGRMSAAGYGEYRPKYSNDTREHKSLNRRVDIVVMEDAYAKFEPKPPEEESP
ncbi:MAG: flagellar motor protein MotB [Fibrobacterota bacterium]